MKNSHVTIKADIDGGTKVEDAFKEVTKLATKIGVCVEFNFNGVICICFPGGDPEAGVVEWGNVINKVDKNKFAFAR